MRAVTEFPTNLLTKGIAAKTALTAEGKTPEEIQASLGETFKFEGDKLKHFFNSLDVAAANMTDLRRVLVVGLSEGEKAPAKAVQVEEGFYVPEFIIKAMPKPAESADPKGRGGRPGGGGRSGAGGRGSDKPKSSPWGLTPEEKAAKNKGAAKATN